jgi:hypothetical protein
VVVISQPEHLHFLHIHRWHVQLWCPQCRRHWETTCGELHCPSYEHYADAEAARAICQLIEDGDLTPPAAYGSVGDNQIVNRPPAPSAN